MKCFKSISQNSYRLWRSNIQTSN